MAAYRRVYDSRHLQAGCKEPGSAPEPLARQLCTGCVYLFTRILPCVWTLSAECGRPYDTFHLQTAVTH